MEMNFPHDQPFAGAAMPVSLRKLDMDILRVLAFVPVTTRKARPSAITVGPDRQAALMALFAGHGRAENVGRGSFNPRVATTLGTLGVVEQQDENGVYHYASANRKAARLLRSYSPMNTNQAF